MSQKHDWFYYAPKRGEVSGAGSILAERGFFHYPENLAARIAAENYYEFFHAEKIPDHWEMILCLKYERWKKYRTYHVYLAPSMFGPHKVFNASELRSLRFY